MIAIRSVWIWYPLSNYLVTGDATMNSWIIDSMYLNNLPLLLLLISLFSIRYWLKSLIGTRIEDMAAYSVLEGDILHIMLINFSTSYMYY